MQVKRSETGEAFVARARPNGGLYALEPTERPFCAARSHRESTKNSYKSLDVWEYPEILGKVEERDEGSADEPWSFSSQRLFKTTRCGECRHFL